MKNFWPIVVVLLVVAALVYKGIANKNKSLKEFPSISAVDSKGNETSPAQPNAKTRAEPMQPAADPSAHLTSASGEKHPIPSGGGGAKIDAAKKLQVLREQSIFKR